MNSGESFAITLWQKAVRVEQSHLRWLQDKFNEYLDGEEYVPALDAGPFLDWVYGGEIQNTLVNYETED
jgi:hypothetical protein